MNLFKAELRRVWKTRSVKVLLAAALLLSVLMAYFPVTFVKYSYMDDRNNEVTITGLEAIRAKKESRKQFSGIITPEMLSAALLQYQETVETYGDVNDPSFPQDIYYEKIYPLGNLVMKINEVYADSKTGLAPDTLTLTTEDAMNFYKQCPRHLKDLMKMEQKTHPSAQKIADSLFEKVSAPYQYYPGYDSNAIEYVGMCIFLLVLICSIIASTIFSTEYQTGADDIIRCTRYGKSRLAIVKIASSLLLFILTFAVCMTVFTIISNTAFGWECRNTSLQIIQSAVTIAAMNLGQVQNATILAGFLTLLATASFTLFLSSKCRSNTAAMGFTIVFLLAPSILYMFFGGEITKWIRCLLPSGGVGMSNSFVYTLLGFEFLHLGDASFLPGQVMMIAAAVEIPLFLSLTIFSYCRHTNR